MDQLIRASVSHTHDWYEVGMLKVPAVDILIHEREQGNIHFPRSADHVQDWQP